MAKRKTKKQLRPGKDEYFLAMAEVVARRTTCNRLKVGSVLVKEGMVISTGYNGAPRGLPHCTEVGCEMVAGHCVRTVHAEQNAVIQAAYHGTPTNGATLYTQWLPCVFCCKTLINAGVKRIVFYDYYRPDKFAQDLLKRAKVKTDRLPKKK